MTICSCEKFFASAGWHCQELDLPGGKSTYISTPLALPGGKPFDFYLSQRGKLIEFTDDGNTMFALSSMGFALDDRRNWRGLENVAMRHGFELSQRGAFEAVFPANDLSFWGASIIRLFCSLADWQEEKTAEGDTDFSLTDEVEMLLRARDARAKLDRDVSVKIGASSYEFSFLWGDTYVDAVRPVRQAVNSRIRKALVMSKQYEDVKMLFVIDDRADPDRAQEERGVLGSIAKAVMFSDFERSSEKPTMQH